MSKRISIVALVFVSSQASCVVVGGYSSERGWFIWPGGLVILAVVALLLFFARRRRR